MLANITGDGTTNVYLGIPAPFDRYPTYVIDSTAPYSVITLMLHLWRLESADELSEAVVSSLPAEECPPVKLHRLEGSREGV